MPENKNVIKSVEGLPKSFCLENYSFTKSLDAEGWARSLMTRYWLLMERSVWINPDKKNNLPFLEPLFKNPRIHDEFMGAQRWWLVNETINDSTLRHLTVSDLHVLTHYLGSYPEYSEDANEVGEFYANCWASSFQWDKSLAEKLGETARFFNDMSVFMVDSKINPSYEKMYLLADITCSDEQLIDEFKKALKHQRLVTGYKPRKRNFNDKDFARWHYWALLPYMDLTLWALVTGNKITQQVMGDAIFPNREIERAQAIRATVKPMAAKLIRRDALNALWLQCGDLEKG